MSLSCHIPRSSLVALSAAASLTITFLLLPLATVFFVANYGVMYNVWFGDPSLASVAWSALAMTFVAATVSTTALALLGTPLAYLMSRYRFRGINVVESVIDLPLMLPHAVAGVLVLVAYGRASPIGALLEDVGLRVVDSFWGIVAVMFFVSAPIYIDYARATFDYVPREVEYVARALGASWWRAFYTVTLPLATRGLVAAYILAWARAVSEVGAILIVAYYPKTINVLIIEWLNAFGLQYGIALTIPLILTSLALFIVFKKFAGWSLRR